MSVKDNFYQAVKELFNKDEEVQSPIGKSLQSSTSDTDEKEKGLDMIADNENTPEVVSTPLKKPGESTLFGSKPNIAASPASAAAGYSSMQTPAKPVEAPKAEEAKPSLFGAKPTGTTPSPFVKPAEAPKAEEAKPASSLFGSRPMAGAPAPSAVSFSKPAEAPKAEEAKPVSSLFGTKPAEPAKSDSMSALFGTKPTEPVKSEPISSLFATKPVTSPFATEKSEQAKPLFSASAVASAAATTPKPTDFLSDVKKVSTDELSASLNAIINEDYRPLSGSLESTVIAHGTIIKGDIQTTADIEINGAVVGNIESQRGVSINGQVEGNVSAESIRLCQTAINGNLTATGLVILDKDSTLIGDIKGDNVIIGGKVKGNIEGKGKATLKSASVVCGNMTVAEITIEDGAKLQGFVQTTNMVATEEN